MGKIRKVARNKRYNYDKNKARKYRKDKKPRTFECKELAQHVLGNQGYKHKFESLGLAYDVNKVVKGPNSLKEEYKTQLGNKGEAPKRKKTGKARRQFVAEAMEADAKIPRISKPNIPPAQIKMAQYYTEKYGDDYQAMTRDPKNYWQYNASQMKKICRVLRLKSTQTQENPTMEVDATTTVNWLFVNKL